MPHVHTATTADRTGQLESAKNSCISTPTLSVVVEHGKNISTQRPVFYVPGIEAIKKIVIKSPRDYRCGTYGNHLLATVPSLISHHKPWLHTVVISLDGTIFDPIYRSYTQRRHLSRLHFLLWSCSPAAFAALWGYCNNIRGIARRENRRRPSDRTAHRGIRGRRSSQKPAGSSHQPSHKQQQELV